MDELVDFIRGRGYVLDFSDSSFARFFKAELDINIEDPVYSELGGSKGKRLRCFLTKTNDSTAIRTLQALWEHRAEWLLQSGCPDPVNQSEIRFQALLTRLVESSSRKHLERPEGPQGETSTKKAGQEMSVEDYELKLELAILKTLKSLGTSEYHGDYELLPILASEHSLDATLETSVERVEYLGAIVLH